MLDKNDAKKYLHSIVQDFVPSNARRYNSYVFNGQPSHNALLGTIQDPPPQTGTVVAMNENWLVMKKGRTEFAVFAKELLPSIPEVGDKVTITPYARRQFDGRRLDEPVVKDNDGYVTRSIVIGKYVSDMPIEKDKIVCPQLQEMIHQVERLPSGDGIRTLAQVLIDAGAYKEPVQYVDPLPSDIFSTPPSLTFNLDTGAKQGALTITYNRGTDYYDITTTDTNGVVVERLLDVDFTRLPEVVVALVDQPDWNKMALSVDKAAPKKRALKP